MKDHRSYTGKILIAVLTNALDFNRRRESVRLTSNA